MPTSHSPSKQSPAAALLSTHEYDEIAIVHHSASRFVVGDEVLDTQPGDILVIKAGTHHGFVNTGTEILEQTDIHLSPRFKQKNLPAGLPE